MLSGITGEYQGTMKKKGWSTGRPSSAVETENGEQKKKKKKRQKKGGRWSEQRYSKKTPNEYQRSTNSERVLK